MKRKENESFEDYKVRRAMDQALKGTRRILWNSYPYLHGKGKTYCSAIHGELVLKDNKAFL
jgi:hypothetical protein